MPAPLDLTCFMIMPLGRIPDTDGTIINYDAVYRNVIAAAITEREERENLKIDYVRCDDIEEAVSYFEMNESQVHTVYLLTYDNEQLTVGLDVLNELVRRRRLEGLVQEYSES